MDHYVPPLSDAVRRWLRFLALLAGLALICWVTFRLRTVFSPLLIAAALAYVLNPLVNWCERIRGLRRLTIVIVVFLALTASVLATGLYLGSAAVGQLAELQTRIPHYVEKVGAWIRQARAAEPAAPESAPAAAPQGHWWNWVAPLAQEHGVTAARTALNYVGGVFASLASLLSLLVLIPAFTFFFLWRFNDGVRALRELLPAPYRDTIVRVVGMVDAAVADFFRGRLIVCLIVGVLTALGWTIVGVPYSVPLGLLAGALNLVPFLSLLALPPALLSTFFGAGEAGQPWLWPLVYTFAVYLLVQGVESFLLGPAIAGRTSGLHPLVTVIVLLIGAELGGVVGMLLAVPVASTLRALAAEWLWPEVRRLAGHAPASGSDTPAG